MTTKKPAGVASATPVEENTTTPPDTTPPDTRPLDSTPLDTGPVPTTPLHTTPLAVDGDAAADDLSATPAWGTAPVDTAPVDGSFVPYGSPGAEGPEAVTDPGFEAAFFADLPEAGPEEDFLPPPTRGVRLRVPTALLALLATLAGGFFIGAVVQKHDGSTASASTTAGRRGLGAGFTGAEGAGGFSRTGAFGTGTGTGAATGAAGTAGAATEGIVTGVKGQILYVTNSAGDLVKVTLAPSATISRVATTTLSGLQTGDTVVIRGTTSGGNVIATSITASPASAASTGATGGAATGGG